MTTFIIAVLQFTIELLLGELEDKVIKNNYVCKIRNYMYSLNLNNMMSLIMMYFNSTNNYEFVVRVSCIQ